MAKITMATNGLRITDADWNEIRETTIAAHETAALFESVAEIADHSDDHEDFETSEGVSVSAYTSPLALWEMKTGQYKLSGNGQRGLWSRIKWGVIDAACEERALETRRPEGVYIHPDLDFMSARVDMEATDDGGETWTPVISYNVASTIVDTWRNALGEWIIPEHVDVQANHIMAVTGAERCFVVALFGGITTRFFVAQRDEEIVSEIVEAVQEFWSCVKKRRRPDDLGARDIQVLNRLNSKIRPETQVVDMRQDTDFLSLIEKKDALSKQANGIKKEIDEIKAKIAARMDGIGSAIISDTKQYTWITVPDKEQPATIKKGYSYLGARKISEKAAGPKLLEMLAS